MLSSSNPVTLSGRPGDSRVLLLDNHLLVVSKRRGVLVQGDVTGDMDLLSQARDFLKHRFNKPGNVFVGLVHRIDRPASGIVVLARTSKAADRLSSQFRERTIRKIYVAIVEGQLSGEGACKGYIVKEDRHPKLVPADVPGAKFASLSWRACPVSSQRSVVSVDLHTGRPHQIRLQLSDLGHPIVGDLRHGAQSEFDGRNLALHASEIVFKHPTRDERVHVSDPPENWGADIEAAISGLGYPGPSVTN